MSQTADRYAKALFELAQEQNNLVAVQETMTEIRTLIKDLKDFRQFLTNPILAYDDQIIVLRKLFEGKVPELAYKFLCFITYKGRLAILKEITDCFDILCLTHAHQIRAQVTTALAIKEEDKLFINQFLKEKLHQEVISNWTLDPSLIGGFRIFAQGKIYDYSFKSQLNHFFQQTTQPA